MNQFLRKIAAIATTSIIIFAAANPGKAATIRYDLDYQLDSGETGSGFFNYDDTSGLVDEEWMRYEVTDGSFLDWDFAAEDFWYWEANEDGVNGVSAGEAIAFSNSYWESEEILQLSLPGAEATNLGWSGEILHHELREISEKEVKKKVPEPGILIGLLAISFWGFLVKNK